MEIPKLFTEPMTRQETGPLDEKMASFHGKMRCHRHRDPWLVMHQGDLIRSPPLREECNLGNFLAVLNVI